VSNSRLALGTVQFGLPYGIANTGGQVSREETIAILHYARSAGLDTLDTAVAYGESEQRLGEIGIGEWKVVSKLPAMPETVADIGVWVREATSAAVGRLRIPRLYGLLLHHPSQLLGAKGEAVYQALAALKRAGVVQKIGVSVYGPEELDALIPRFQFDLVQAPFNAIDRRLVTTGWLARLRQAGVEVHVRSVFLQGLLLMNAGQRPVFAQRWRELWGKWDAWLRANDLNALQACLAIVLAETAIDRVVVGFDNRRQLEEAVTVAGLDRRATPLDLNCDDPELINPSLWPKSGG